MISCTLEIYVPVVEPAARADLELLIHQYYEASWDDDVFETADPIIKEIYEGDYRQGSSSASLLDVESDEHGVTIVQPYREDGMADPDKLARLLQAWLIRHNLHGLALAFEAGWWGGGGAWFITASEIQSMSTIEWLRETAERSSGY